ncbi:hypothetical protein ACEQ8H_002524 [Pleosporales sp. CAS-2024a]
MDDTHMLTDSDTNEPTNELTDSGADESKIESLGLMTDGELATALQDCLDHCEHYGSYSSFRVYDQYPSPGLAVKDIGVVGFPLSPRDAKTIASLCKQAPFGKGDHTVVDENVRKTWELDTNEFQCTNSHWHTFIGQLATLTIQDLGVGVACTAQPYKLLLYEEGAFFKTHRDTEKVRGMFGTLVVCLPSAHEGGSVRLVHGNQENTLETAPYSAFQLSTLAWYSDVQHEILPVASGHRLVLTYNLVQDLSVPAQSAAALDASQTRLNQLLQSWTSGHPGQNVFVYPLQHQYTPSSLSLQNLKGADAAKGQILEKFCSQNGVYWFLAEMIRSVDDGESWEGAEDESFTVRRTVFPSGHVMHLYFPSKDLHADTILANLDGLYEDRAADSEDEGHYTGNASMPANFRYHDTVAIMVRKEYLLKLFADNGNQSVESLRQFFALLSEDRSYAPEQRDFAMGIVLKQCLQANTGDYYGLGYQYRVRNYNPKANEAPGYLDMFEQVADFCHKHGISSAVRCHLRNQMSKARGTMSEALLSLVARQVARDVSDGADDVFEFW